MDYVDTTTLDLVGKYLKDNDLKVFVGESMTGGFLGSILSLQVDSGAYFLGGITGYDNAVKKAVLQVDEQSIAHYTAESPEVTFEMLEGLKKIIAADVYIAITGMAYADPSDEHEAHVGDIFVAISFLGIHMHKTLHCIDHDAAQLYITAVNHVILELNQFVLHNTLETN